MAGTAGGGSNAAGPHGYLFHGQEEAMLTSPSLEDTTLHERTTVQEELERKLLLRADRDDLVNRNILPAVSTSPVLLAQTQQLQKAKTMDSLQQKLRDRVSRTHLMQRNILPDLKGDPSLQAKQLQLRKKKLADDLNERLANRPGPLQLVQHRILEPANSELVQAVQTLKKPSSTVTPPVIGQRQQWNLGLQAPPLKIPPPPILKSTAVVTPDLSPSEVQQQFTESYSPAPSPGESLSPQKSPPSLTSPPSVPPSSSSSSKHRQLYTSGVLSGQLGKAPSPSQVRKKQLRPKYRKLRYHEYVPPNKSNSKGSKTSGSKASKLDTPYALLLQQQQLFLQLQVLQQQYPNGVLMQKLPELMKTGDKGKAKAGALNETLRTGGTAIKTHEIPEDIKVRSGAGSVTVRLDELKVNNLKAACKELNLTVSGKKIDLIERLMEHNNGILPASVLSRQGLNHTASTDSMSAHSTMSPGSPDPATVFQFPGEQGGKTLDAGTLMSPVGAGLTAAQVIPASNFKQQFEQIVERQKIDYFSQKGLRTVTPRPDLKEMVAIVPCSTSSSLSLPPQTSSLPDSPKPSSPPDQSLLHEFMEHSPGPLSSASSHVSNPTPSTSTAGFFVKPHLHLRPIRSSLPNTASSQYSKSDQSSSAAGSQLMFGSGSTGPASGSGRLSGRSYSLSIPPPSHQLPSSLSLDLPGSSSHLSSGDTFLLPTPEDPTELMDAMDTGFSHDDRLSDIFEILQQEDTGFNLGGSLSQPTSYNYMTNAGKLQNRQDSTQSDTPLLNMAATGTLGQQNRSGSDLSLLSGGSRGDGKAPPTIATGISSNGSYGDLGWLNIDNCGPLLGTASPNLPSYCDLSAGSLGLPPPPDQFQLSLMDDPSLKNTANNGLTSSGEMFLDAAASHSMLFGSDDTHLLDHHNYR